MVNNYQTPTYKKNKDNHTKRYYNWEMGQYYRLLKKLQRRRKNWAHEIAKDYHQEASWKLSGFFEVDRSFSISNKESGLKIGTFKKSGISNHILETLKKTI